MITVCSVILHQRSPVWATSLGLEDICLFIKNGAVLRLDSITDIVRVACRSGVGVSVTVKDENGSMSLHLCMVHRFNDRAEIDEIRRAVFQRQ